MYVEASYPKFKCSRVNGSLVSPNTPPFFVETYHFQHQGFLHCYHRLITSSGVPFVDLWRRPVHSDIVAVHTIILIEFSTMSNATIIMIITTERAHPAQKTREHPPLPTQFSQFSVTQQTPQQTHHRILKDLCLEAEGQDDFAWCWSNKVAQLIAYLWEYRGIYSWLRRALYCTLHPY